jgi:hypothetical protein
MKIALFLWAKIGRPKSETGDSVPPSLPVVRWPIPAITSDEARQGVARGHEAGVGDSPESKRNGGAHCAR